MLRTGSVKSCPGVCAAERIADYCEAVINTPDLCKPGLKCCVSKDAYGHSDVKPLNFITRDRNGTTSTTTSSSISDQSHTNFHTNHVAPTTSTTTLSRLPPNTKGCQGECVNGLLALFCDDIDSSATCPEDESCCITKPVSNPPPHSTSSYYNTNTSPRPAPTHYSQMYTTTTSSPTTSQNQPTPNLPKCPGFCLLNLMAAFCERPAVIVPHTATCKKGSICCDNTKSGTSHKPRPHTTVPTTTTVMTTTSPAPPDHRPDCPGSCIVPYLSFTCFSKSIDN